LDRFCSIEYGRSMLFRRSNSLAVLALAAGCFAPCALSQSVPAGDKIEFSAPSVPLAVPQVQSEEKELTKASVDASLRPDTSALEVLPEETLVLVPQKRKSARSPDSASTFADNRDNRDDSADADSSYGSLDQKLRPIQKATNLWDLSRAWDQDSERNFSDRRGDNPANRDNLHERLDPWSAARGIDRQRNDPFGRDSSASTEDTTWSHSFFHHELSGVGGTRDGQVDSFYDDVKAAATPAPAETYSLPIPYSASDEMLRESKLPPRMVEYNLQLDAMRGKTPDETPGARLTFHPVETRPVVSQNPDPYARQEPPPSPPGEVQARPAILPFPKRPGSVFQ
jgi:hypothetical protein